MKWNRVLSVVQEGSLELSVSLRVCPGGCYRGSTRLDENTIHFASQSSSGSIGVVVSTVLTPPPPHLLVVPVSQGVNKFCVEPISISHHSWPSPPTLIYVASLVRDDDNDAGLLRCGFQ